MTFVDWTSHWRCGLTSRDCPFSTVEVGQDFTCSVNVVAARPTCFLVCVRARARFTDHCISALCRRFPVGLRYWHTADVHWMRNGWHYNRVRRCAPTVLPRMLTNLKLRFLYHCGCFVRFLVSHVLFLIFPYMLYKLTWIVYFGLLLLLYLFLLLYIILMYIKSIKF